MIGLSDPSDRRLDDYRSLNDQAFRRRYEGDEIFIVEGYVAIDRLIESGHRVRSVLLAPSRVERFAHGELLASQSVPVFVADREVMAEVVGFDLHRGVIACAERRPAPTVAELVSTARRLAVLEGLNDNENLGAIARAAKALRHRRAAARPDLHRSVQPPHRAGEHGRGADVADRQGRQRRLALGAGGGRCGRFRAVGDDPGVGCRRASGISRFPTGWR